MAQKLITKQVLFHCKRGWENCEKCLSVYDYKYTLLLLNPSDNPQAARPVIKTAEGWVTYDIKQWFNSLQEAQQYSKAHQIPIQIAKEDTYPLLQQLAQKLPPKWFLKIDPDNTLLIYSPQTIYTYYENKINAPVFNSKNKEQFAKEQGKKTYPSIQYTIKKPLSKEEKKEIEQKNSIISQQIKTLPKKYQIEHLKPEYVHGKDVYPNYPNATQEEKKRIEAYQKELEQLQKEYLPLPMYTTPDFDLWNEIIIGVESATENVFPENISQETIETLKMVRNFFYQN